MRTAQYYTLNVITLHNVVHVHLICGAKHLQIFRDLSYIAPFNKQKLWIYLFKRKLRSNYEIPK